jgi:hypothetical protein
MANIDCVKLDDTAARRTSTDIMWNEISVGDIVSLKFKSHSRGNVKNKKFEYKKYKVLNKQHMKILVEKVDNRMKETFTFADFLTGDVIYSFKTC